MRIKIPKFFKDHNTMTIGEAKEFIKKVKNFEEELYLLELKLIMEGNFK